jgi:superfamily II DNA or RNA helicase
MISLKNLLARAGQTDQEVDPIRIFQNLRVSDPGLNDLWLAQGDALREWHSCRDLGDVAVALNTGAGKSLVGLLIAQSLVNETRRHVVYACASIQLIEQTEQKAKGYGLEVTTYFKGDFSNYLYTQGRALCLTTYQALFNGKSKFRNDDIAAIVFDDCHTATHIIRDQFSLSVSAAVNPPALCRACCALSSIPGDVGC